MKHTNVELKIEKGIPLKPKGNASDLSAVLKAMEIGDSFFVSKRPQGMQLSHYAPKKFATRAVDGGFRVWRTE